jgi:hypothetical protein
MKRFIRELIIRSPVLAHNTPGEDIGQHWKESCKLTAKLGITNQRRKKKVGFDAKFQEYAGKASQHYASFVPDDFISKKGRTSADIRATHSRNLESAYQKWETNTNRVYETKDGIPAKLYQERVDAGLVNYIKGGEKSFRVNGTRNGILGVVPLAVHYLAGESSENLPAGVDGAPYNIAKYRLGGTFKTALQCRLSQGAILILNQKLQKNAIDAENELNTALLNGLRDPNRCDEFVNTPDDNKCFCLWEVDPDSETLYLHLQVGRTAEM